MQITKGSNDSRCNPFDTITIVIILDILYSDFKTTRASMFETEDKTIKEIQSIIQLKKAKYKAKWLTAQLEKAAMVIVKVLYIESDF